MKIDKNQFEKFASSLFTDLKDNDVKTVDSEFRESLINKEANAMITAALPAILGSLVGFGTTRDQVNQQAERDALHRKVTENNSTPDIEKSMFNKDYYTQIYNIEKNMKPTFSPFGVIYMINLKGQNLTLDNIDTSEMNDEMKKAWAEHDEGYYKRLFMNKIVSEVQLVEQMFAKRMVQNFSSMNQRFGVKQASYDESNLVDLLDGVCRIRDIYREDNKSKIIEVLAASMNAPDSEINIECKLNRPIDKYAGIMSKALNFLTMDSSSNQLKSTAKDMANVKNISNAQVEFLPDRVIFIKNNIVITQLPIIQMSQEGYSHFREKDTAYFKQEFIKSMSRNINEIKSINSMNKKAMELIKREDIFGRSDIDPKIYFLLMNKELGAEWLTYDPEVLISEVEDYFHLDKPIVNVALNKLLIIQLINQSVEPYRNALIFEKCIRAFNDKTVEFDEWQLNIEVKELMYALMRMEDLTELDSISDNFSHEIVEYMATILYNNGMRNLIDTTGDTRNSLTDDFYEMVNAELLDKWNSTVSNPKSENKMIEDNIAIATISNKLYNSIDNIAAIGGEKIDKIIDNLATKNKLSTFVTNCIKQTVKLNAIIDSYCTLKNLELEDQIKNIEQ